MEIKPTYVTFEQAKILKDKGFDVSTLTVFDDENGIIISSYSKDVFSPKNYNTSGYKTSRPEQSQVIEWIRINHGIFISVETDCYGEIWFSKLTCCSEQNWENLDKRHEIVSASNKFNNEHNSPQEAYSASFDYVLNNLI